MKFGKKGKLTLIFIGLFFITKRVDTMAYLLALPKSLSYVHDVFDVSMLRKCFSDSTFIVDYSEVILHEDAIYEAVLCAILVFFMKKLQNNEISIVKVQWSDSDSDRMWEFEESIR